MEHVRNALSLFTQYPDLGAGILGIFFSMVATQFIKKLLPDSWSDENYRKVVQLLAFVTGWVFTHGAWVLLDPTSSHFEKVYASAGCGFASPAFYSFLSSWLSHKYPWFEPLFSGRPKVHDAVPNK